MLWCSWRWKLFHKPLYNSSPTTFSESQDSLLAKCQTHDWKVLSSNPSRKGRTFFSSRVNFVCWLLFGVPFTFVLQQWHIKDPSHCTKSTGGRLHLDMYTPLTQWGWISLTMPMSRHSVGTYHSGKKAPIQLTGNTRPQSSSLAEPLWTDPGLPKEWN